MDDGKPTPRPETGPMRFGDDWTGVFIRGDNAAGYLVMAGSDMPPGLRDLLSLSNDADERERDGIQRMRPFAECLATPAEPDDEHERCEQCRAIVPLDDVRRDVESVPFCPGCYESLARDPACRVDPPRVDAMPEARAVAEAALAWHALDYQCPTNRDELATLNAAGDRAYQALEAAVTAYAKATGRAGRLSAGPVVAAPVPPRVDVEALTAIGHAAYWGVDVDEAKRWINNPPGDVTADDSRRAALSVSRAVLAHVAELRRAEREAWAAFNGCSDDEHDTRLIAAQEASARTLAAIDALGGGIT